MAITAAACAIAAGVLSLGVLNAAPDESGAALAARALGVVLPIGLGLLRLSKREGDRLAKLLVGAGVVWSFTTLTQSDDATLYSIGRAAVWVVEPVIVYLLLTFPSGRLSGPAPRRLFIAAVLLAGLLYLPTALVAPFPSPSPWAACVTHCPANALTLGHGLAAFVHDVVRPVREVLTALLYVAIAAWVARRARGAAPLLRRALVPVAVIAVVRAIALPVYDAARIHSADGWLTQIAGWLYLLSLPGLTVAFAVGLLNQRLFVADALKRLTIGLPPHPDAAELREAMADALQDPSLRIAFRMDGEDVGWVDEHGAPTPSPANGAGPGRGVTEVGANGHRIAVIGEDTGLSQDPAFVRAATAYALTRLENDRLAGRLQASVVELARSRARIVAVAARERRKIERDLHDGAQQRLVALRIKLELAAEQLESESPAAAATIRGLEADVDATVDEVRSFARGIYPSLLAGQGISQALRAAGRSSPVRVLVDADGIGRYPPEIEATVYFACIEALQNAGKHAPGAPVTIVVAEDDTLHFEVHDGGPGFDTDRVARGAGLVNMGDRLAAVGGTLDVRSSPRDGTRVIGSIPVR